MPKQYYEVVLLVITDEEGLITVKLAGMKEVEPPEKEKD